MAADLIEDPVLKQRYRFTRETKEDGSEILRVEFWTDPGGGVTPHVHPNAEERFTVMEGRPSFLSGRKWSDAGPGETVVVPAGTRHAYRNRSDETVHVVCEVSPPDLLAEFLTEAAEMNQAGMLTSNAFPKSPRAALQVAVMAEHYREMVVFGFPPAPPPPVQRLLFPPLARFAKKRGYRSGQQKSPVNGVV